MSKKWDAILRKNMKKESMKSKRPQDWKKKLLTKISKKLPLKDGKIWNKVLKMSTTRQLRKLVKWLAQMLKVRPNKPNKISNKVLRKLRNLSKKPHYHKNLSHSKQSKKFKNGPALTPRAKQKTQSSISSKDLKTQDKALKKQQDMKDQNYNKPSKTSPRECKTLRKVSKMRMTRLLRN